MGKDWDKAVVGVETWRECLRVLKPGAFAFVMSAPRQDVLGKMIVNLTEAGFKTDFTSIYWTYACLSADTEVLTQDGWKDFEHLHKSNFSDRIVSYEWETDTYELESPTAWNQYQVAEDLYRIESKDTCQLVTRNHRVPTTIGTRLAENLSKQAKIFFVPSLPDGIRHLSSGDSQETRNSGNVLLNQLPAKSSNQTNDSKRSSSAPDVREAETATARGDDGGKEPRMERRRDVLEETWKLQTDKVRPLPEGFIYNGSEGRLCDGASPDCGESSGATTNTNGDRSSCESRPAGQSAGESDAVRHKQGTQTLRSWEVSCATVGREFYEGIVYCPTTSTGYFLARRNGKMFITGNSGFPKAANIGKMVDKRLGVKREVIGHQILKGNAAVSIKEKGGTYVSGASLTGLKEIDLTAATSPEAKALDGSYGGFQPKPALECVLVCMKPLSEKTYVDQALANGKGITWLDDGRIPTCREATEGDKICSCEQSLTPSPAANAVSKNNLDAAESALSFVPANAVTHGLEKMNGTMQDDISKKDTSCSAGMSEESISTSSYMSGSGSESTVQSPSEQSFITVTETSKTIDSPISNSCPVHSTEATTIRKGGNSGRFPANILVSDDALNDGVERKTGTAVRHNSGGKNIHSETEKPPMDDMGYGDSGSYSRFFSLDAWWQKKIKDLPESVQRTFPFLIVPKASKREKNAGCENIPEQQVTGGGGLTAEAREDGSLETASAGGKYGSVKAKQSNNHPTTKPLTLMSYLITLGSRPGDTVLDPFLGSGTTACAAKMLGRRYIGIEREAEYVEIARARISAIPDPSKLPGDNPTLR